ncbi:uncharacterized protein B0I36DRAFT_327231 [Microdochium trichocladiopsis]|uniref:Uncharacterized protein n=1 Tax=Microdochium trichocladiopsis TaxID=1682393 RepID=A0A9P9BNA4_9PEZI|nr:uncharacterized protein B0I36DRAFT_327231 [Microdochium trichocladiopsis]KAH7027506.1 hypothetical protein B0I36DRAFT_327231 [Microdochium trichocladiopsis]
MLLFSWGAALTTISAIVLADMLKVPVRPAQLDWVCYFGLPFGAIDMVWNAAEILTHCARGGESIYPRGIHSGAHVGVHLIMWLFSCVGICFGALSIEVFNAANVICNSPSNGAPYYPFLPYPFQSCTYYQRNPIFLDPTVEYVKSLLAGYCVTILVHLTLFVWACVDTHHRNRLSLGGLLAPPGPSGMFGDTAMTKLAESVPVQPIHQDVEKGQDATQEVPLVEAKVLQHPHNPILHSGAKDANHETTPATANEPIALTEEPQRS